MKTIKQYLSITAIATFILLGGSCKEETYDYPEGTVGISKITYYPILTLKGTDYLTVIKGSVFTDPGVTAKEGTTDLKVTTTGTVNTATAGVYTLTYSAVNKDGFSASTTRRVIVYSTDVSAAANDLSGSYARNTNGSVVVWTKLAPGVYKVFNPGGAPGTNLTVVIFNPTGLTVLIPSQAASDGSITSSSNESYVLTPTPRYSMVILNPTYGTALRTFIKQ